MELHFYTTYGNVQSLQEGDEVKVWAKQHASPNDIHVSFNMKKYAFHQLAEGIFQVSLK